MSNPYHTPEASMSFCRRLAPMLGMASCLCVLLAFEPLMAEDAADLPRVNVTGERLHPSVIWFGKMRDAQMRDFLSGASGPGRPLGAPPPPANNDRSADPNNPCADESDNPVVLTSGNKVLDEHDFATAPGDFVVGRTYSRNGGFFVGFGPNWSWSLGYQLKFEPNPAWTPVCQPGTAEPGMPCPLVPGKFLKVTAVRPDGHRYDYTWNATSQRYEDSRPVSTSWIVEELWSGASPLSALTLWREDGGRERY